MKPTEVLKKKKIKTIWKRVVAVIASCVVFVVTYALLLPAITMDVSRASQEPGFVLEQTAASQFAGIPCTAVLRAAPDGLEEVQTEASAESEPAGEEPEKETAEESLKAEAQAEREEAEEAPGEEPVPEPEVKEETIPAEEPEEPEEASAPGASDQRDAEAAKEEDQKADEKAADTSEEKNADADAQADQAGQGESGKAAGGSEEKSDSSAAALTATESGSAGDEGDAAAINNKEETADTDGSAESKEAAEDAEAAEAAEEAEDTDPELDPITLDEVLNRKTGFYFYHIDQSSREENISSETITDWEKAEDKTVLEPADIVRVYLAYTIPAGTLNSTNATVRYRLPDGLKLSDNQIKTINKWENGYYKTADKDVRNTYIGAEALEGTRTPDRALKDGETEFISATVKADVLRDANGKEIGQELVFTFLPYTIEKNKAVFDAGGKKLSGGKEVEGYFTIDLLTSQIGFENTSEKSAEADILFAEENKAKGIREISRSLRMNNAAADDGDDTGNAGASDAADAESAQCPPEQEGRDASEREASFEDALHFEGEDYAVDIAYGSEAGIPENAELAVREIQAGTEEYDTYFRQAQDTVDENKEVNSARFFDITILADGEEIEPAAPVQVNITFAGIPQTDPEDTQLIHYTDDDATLLEEAEFSSTEEVVDTVQFEAESFSVYGIVGTEVISGGDETFNITQDGWTVTVHTPEEAFPAGTEMKIAKVTDPEVLVKMASAFEDDKVRSIVAVDISFFYEGEEIEPAKPVEVTLKSNLLPEEEYQIVHLKNDENAEVIEDATTEEGKAEFTLDSFSAVGASARVSLRKPRPAGPRLRPASSPVPSP